MKVHLCLVLALALGLMLSISYVASAGPDAGPPPCDRYVLGLGGSDAGDCSNGAQPCQTVQYAINHAAGNDVICVADNTGVPGATVYPERIVIPRTLTLDGKWAATCRPFIFSCTFTPVKCEPDMVILDGESKGRVITIKGRYAPTIDCFTITRGDAAGLGGDPGTTIENDAGGGIYGRDAAPIIINNVITANFGCNLCPLSYGRGGGIYLLNAPGTAVIRNNVIARNVADESTWGQGGGILLRDSSAQVVDNTIAWNRAGHSAGDGGGIFVSGGRPVITGNYLMHNVAGRAVMGNGGGIFVSSSTPATITHNILESNQALSGAGSPGLASRGGGICYMGVPTVTAVIRDNTLSYNLASAGGPVGYGGGIYVSSLVTPSMVTSNTLDSNVAGFNDDGSGGGIYVDDSVVTLSDNNIHDNVATWAGTGTVGQGGGVYVNGGAVRIATNDIVHNHGAYFPGLPSTADGWGGGIALWDSIAIVQNNLIANNNGTNAAATTGAGGGLYVYRGQLTLTHNMISGNQATGADRGYGGGMYLEGPRAWVDANTIVDNTAAAGTMGRGGGIRIGFSPAFTLTNNIVARNGASEFGSGIAIGGGSHGLLAHNTLADNTAGTGHGIHIAGSSDAMLYNTLMYHHTTGIVNADPAGSTVSAQYTLFDANIVDFGPGVLTAFDVPGIAGLLPDYHLSLLSGARDQGTLFDWIKKDIDGDRRRIGANPDVGADEYVRRWYLPVVVRHGS